MSDKPRYATSFKKVSPPPPPVFEQKIKPPEHADPYWMVHTDADNATGGPLPAYGEVRIVTHGGKVTFVETTTKEKVE